MHLIYGVCLPLAVLIGYLLAEPYDLGSIAVMGLVFLLLCIPLLMRWHHAILLFSCNALIMPYFLPGRPMIWILVAGMSFTFLLMNRAVGRNVGFFLARDVTRSLIFLTIVVAVTVYLTGGGFGSMGSRSGGGKRYVTILAAIMAYFGLSTTPIPRKWAGLATSVFFLSALTGLIGYIVGLIGPSLYFLVELFPIEGEVTELNSLGLNLSNQTIVRAGGFTSVSLGLLGYLLARHGVRGLFDLTKPWRLLLLLMTFVMCLLSGFRSAVIMPVLILVIMGYMEGVHRTQLFPILAAVAILGCALLIPTASKLPLVMQRTLTFLPISLDPIARAQAEASTDWRVEMWKDVVPTIPKYLIKGKGYAISQEDLALIEQAEHYGTTRPYELSMAAGDYHSGPLSLIIPLGLFGVLGFAWFLTASVNVLLRNYRHGDPALHKINTFLLVFFITRILFYIFVFGGFYSDLIYFTSLIGLSVSLNGGVCEPRGVSSDTLDLDYLEPISE